VAAGRASDGVIVDARGNDRRGNTTGRWRFVRLGADPTSGSVRQRPYPRRVASRAEHHGAFGPDAFGRGAERAARFFGTPQYIVGQSLLVVVWIAVNSIAVAAHWDPYPFILLNLAFSTQAAYAAPLILLAQTRQADRDKRAEVLAEQHREHAERQAIERVEALKQLLDANTDLTRQDKELTEQVADLTREIHAALTRRA
jgi:uncharacterized membrane protein